MIWRLIESRKSNWMHFWNLLEDCDRWPWRTASFRHQVNWYLASWVYFAYSCFVCVARVCPIIYALLVCGSYVIFISLLVVLGDGPTAVLSYYCRTNRWWWGT
jgi:hypothetical protein